MGRINHFLFLNKERVTGRTTKSTSEKGIIVEKVAPESHQAPAKFASLHSPSPVLEHIFPLFPACSYFFNAVYNKHLIQL